MGGWWHGKTHILTVNRGLQSPELALSTHTLMHSCNVSFQNARKFGKYAA
jgi:hypothetical protein